MNQAFSQDFHKGVSSHEGWHAPTRPTSAPNYQLARHPDYIDRNERLYSFATWRFSHIQDPTHLINLGFFYTGQGDIVRCFYCSVGLKDFISSDDPLLEHVRYSGDCEYLVQLLGPSRLREIKESLQAGIRVQTSNRLTYPRSGITGTSSASSPEAVQQDRHPEYRSYSVRLASFVGWPGYLVQTPESVAEAGFYFTGTRDIVRCYSCDGGLEKWDPNDDPWIEHCINFPDCRYLRETKGEAYIALARNHCNQPAAIGLTPPTTQAIRTELGGFQPQKQTSVPSQTVNRTVCVQQVTEMGFNPTDINRAVEVLSKNKTKVSVEAIIDEIQSLGKDESGHQTGKCPSKDLYGENQDLVNQLFCIQCKTAETNSLFLPCQHHRFCIACSGDLTTCPICGRPISQKIKTYRP